MRLAINRGGPAGSHRDVFKTSRWSRQTVGSDAEAAPGDRQAIGAGEAAEGHSERPGPHPSQDERDVIAVDLGLIDRDGSTALGDPVEARL